MKQGIAVALLLLTAGSAAAQTDYYNTDLNRPVRIEDAYTTERYALELKLAPLRLERGRGGVYEWGFDPEIAYGILPRTSVEVGLPVVFMDGEGGRTQGLAGLELSAFHNLNVETRGLPAMAVRADVVLPVGSLAPGRVYPSLTGIVTRTWTWARFHVNGQYTFGEAGADEGAHELSRWEAGVAVDRTFPLRSMLLIGSVYASEPLGEGETAWRVEAGTRYQVSPYLAVDVGAGREVTGDGSWYVTFGSAYHIGVRSLMPVRR